MVYQARLRGIQRRLCEILGNKFCSESIEGLVESGLETKNFRNRHSWLENYGGTSFAWVSIQCACWIIVWQWMRIDSDQFTPIQIAQLDFGISSCGLQLSTVKFLIGEKPIEKYLRRYDLFVLSLWHRLNLQGWVYSRFNVRPLWRTPYMMRQDQLERNEVLGLFLYPISWTR